MSEIVASYCVVANIGLFLGESRASRLVWLFICSSTYFSAILDESVKEEMEAHSDEEDAQAKSL